MTAKKIARASSHSYRDRVALLKQLTPGIYTFVFDFRRDAWGKVRGLSVSMPEADSVAYYVRE